MIASSPAYAQPSKWTFMVYLDADNNLEDIGIDNFLSMAEVGSTDQIKIVVQFDRNSGIDPRYGDWSTTKRFLVGQGMVPDSASALQDLGELNMADPATLSDFVKWAAATYPADRYFLDIWDHGLGWQGVATDDTPSPNDHMTAVELGTALAEIRNYLGRPLDILANDACRMTLEIMYEASPYVTYFVGSEKDEPAEGWPYDTVLGSLVANPNMDPVQLGTMLVNRYVDKYRAGSSYSVTMALVDSSALPALVSSLDEFVEAVNYSLPYFVDSVVLARNQSEHYEGNQCSFPYLGDDYDLSDVATNAQRFVNNGRVYHAAERLKQAVGTAVIHEDHMDLATAVNCVKARNATGLSLWYQWTISGTKLREYGDLAMSKDGLWDEHLRTYHNTTRPDVPFQATLVPEDLDSDTRLDNARLTFASSQAGTVVVDQYLDEMVISTFTYQTSQGVQYVNNISLPSPGTYDFYLYFRQSQGIMNATSFLDLQATVTLTFIGLISNQFGTPVNQANVTITNLRTGQTLTTFASDGLYSVAAIYPVWIRQGDTVRIEASKDGHNAFLEFSLQYMGVNSFQTDLYLDAGFGGGTDGGSPLGFILLLSIAFTISFTLEMIFLAAILIRSRRKGR